MRDHARGASPWSVGPAACSALGEVSHEAGRPVTVFSGRMDQTALFDLLGRFHAFGLELIDVHRASDVLGHGNPPPPAHEGAGGMATGG